MSIVAIFTLIIILVTLLIWPFFLGKTRGVDAESAYKIKETDNKIILLYAAAVVLVLLGILLTLSRKDIEDASEHSSRIESSSNDGNAKSGDTDSASDSHSTTADNGEPEDSAPVEEEPVNPYEVINGVTYTDIPSAAYTCEFDEDDGKFSFVCRDGNSLEIAGVVNTAATDLSGASGKSAHIEAGYGIQLHNIKANTTGDYTISFWYKPYSNIPDWTPIFHAAYDLENENNSVRLRMICKDSVAPIVSSEVVSKGISEDINAQIGQQDLVGHWNHIVLAVNSSIKGEKNGTVNARIFVNGEYRAGNDVAIIDMRDSVVTLGISIYDDPIEAEYDSVKIFDYMLSDEQINTLYWAY